MRTFNSIEARRAQEADAGMTQVVRLVIEPERNERRIGRFRARLESTGEVIVQGTRQPLVDGARALVERGFDPATPLTLRHAGQPLDSFTPTPIGQWAAWSYSESEKHALKRRRWMPLHADRERQKSTSKAVPVLQARPWPKSLYGAPVRRQSARPSLRRAGGRP